MNDDVSEMINLTPLLDVLFVVLILFILIAPMLEIDKIQLAEGSEKRSTLQNDRELKVVVDGANRVTINGKEIPIKLLPLEAKNFYEKSPTLTPALYQDKTATFGTYQAVKNAFELAGFEQLDVVLAP